MNRLCSAFAWAFLPVLPLSFTRHFICRQPWHAWLSALANAYLTTFIHSHAAAAFGLAFMIMPSGMIVRLISPELTGWTRPPDVLIIGDPMGFAMMAGLIIKEVPFLLLVTLSAMAQCRYGARTQALGLWAHCRVFAFELAAVYPQIRLAVFAVIAFSSSVDVAVILGPTNPPTLAIKLLDWMRDPDLTARFWRLRAHYYNFSSRLATILIWFGLERLRAFLLVHWRMRGMRAARDRSSRLAINMLIWFWF